MIEEHLDPTVEAHTHITNVLRTLVTAASATAERGAQRRAQDLHEIQRHTDRERRDLEQRTRVERQAAELVYRRAYQDTWWTRARPGDIADAVTAARTWAASDPRADHALRHIAAQLQDRYGIDLDDLDDLVDLHGVPDPVGVADAVRDRAAGSHVPSVQDPTTAPWEAAATLLQAAGPVLGSEILHAKGWHHLHQRLDALHHAGIDVPAQLRHAVTERELNSAKDKVLALTWRLKTPAASGHNVSSNDAPARHAARSSPPAKGPSKASRSTQAARRFADNQRRTDSQRDTGPGPSTGL